NIVPCLFECQCGAAVPRGTGDLVDAANLLGVLRIVGPAGLGTGVLEIYRSVTGHERAGKHRGNQEMFYCLHGWDVYRFVARQTARLFCAWRKRERLSFG